MKKIALSKLDLDLYEEVLDNGLSIYVIPMPNVNNIYATLSTKFGSNDTSFIPIGEKEMIKVPEGIAHFLEHKMFEQKDGIDPFTFFSERGCDANANTNNFKTTYLFSGTSFFEENMNYLLDYVQDPYFTDENVSKEKGIIEQEMKMYMDNPYSVLYERLVYNTFNEHPIKYPVIGNYNSIYSTTKEDLYKCYNTFYHPSNMFVCVTGNVDANDVIEIIRENQSKKEFKKSEKIILKKYDEKETISKEKDEIKMNVSIPKVGVGYKFIINDIDLPYKKIYNYLGLLFDIKYDSTSLLNEELINDGIIKEDLYISAYLFDKYAAFYILADTNNPDELINKIKDNLDNINIMKEDFERKKKASLASLISLSDDTYILNSKVMNNVIRYNKVITDEYDQIKELNYDEFIDVISKLKFNNITTCVINPK